MSDETSSSPFLKVVAILLWSAGFGWLFLTSLVPQEHGVLDGSKYCLSMLFVIPVVFANFLFPRTDEKSSDQARWFGIVSGIIAIPLATMLTYAYVAGKLHWKV